MSEGWKEQIKLSVGHDPRYWDIEEVHSEIDRVYTQATKADEYKAKAFDLISIALDKNTKIQPDRMGWINTADFTSDVEDIIREYESGEYDD